MSRKRVWESVIIFTLVIISFWIFIYHLPNVSAEEERLALAVETLSLENKDIEYDYGYYTKHIKEDNTMIGENIDRLIAIENDAMTVYMLSFFYDKKGKLIKVNATNVE